MKSKRAKMTDRIREFLKLTVFKPNTLYTLGELGLMNGEQLAQMMIVAVDKADRLLKQSPKRKQVRP